MHLILISGYKRSGKNALADAICGNGNWRFSLYSACAQTFAGPYVQQSFAASLKDEVSAILGKPLDWIEKNKDVGTPSPRDMMIEIAAKNRAANPNHYADILFSSLPAGNYIITDWRYPNEHARAAKWCEDIGARLTTIRVIRSDIEPPDAPSERALDGVLADVIATSPDDPIADMMESGLFQFYKKIAAI
jgi:hypothetical protein